MTATARPRPSLTWHCVEKWAALRPEAEAVVFGSRRLSWADLKREVDRTAKAFLDLGVRKGDRVALISMARSEFITTYLAANKVGAVWFGLSPKFTTEELRYILGDAQPSVIISLAEYMGRDLTGTVETLAQQLGYAGKVLFITETGENCGVGEPFAEFVGRDRAGLDGLLAQRAAEVEPGDLALLMYTSGSTGKPKGVLHTHRSVVCSAEVEAFHFGLTNESRGLLHFPINHVAADVEIALTSLLAGNAVVMMDRFDPVESLRTIEQERITLVGQVPAMYLMQFGAPPFAQMDWSSVKVFAYGGSTPPRLVIDTLASIAGKVGARLMTGYGSTEVAGFVTYADPDDDLDTLCETVGKVVAPFELRVVDEQRREVPDGTVGELAIRGDTVMHGYLNKPNETAAVLDGEGWYYSGDLGWKDARGYLRITGRKSEMYKTGGENVFPREIEEVLESHPAVLFAAVIGVPDPVYHEVGWAFVAPKPGCAIEEDELGEHCKERLVNFKTPKRFLIRPQLPLLPNGKVNKSVLKEEIGRLSEERQ